MRPIYWFAIIVASLGWAYGAIGTRLAYGEDVGPWTQVGMRISIAAVLVALIIVVRKIPMPSRAELKYGLNQAIFNLTIPYVLFTFAYDEASAGFVGLLAALIPISTAAFANFMLRDEKLTFAKFIGLFVAFTGVAALLLSGDSGLSEGGRPVVAVGLGLTAVASIGYAGAFAKKHTGEYNPTMLTGLQFGYATIWLLVAMLAIEGLPTDVSGAGWAIIISMAVASTVLPFLILFWLYKHISATDASLTGYLVPFITLAGGLLLLDEELQRGIIIGGILVLIGIVLADLDTRRRAKKAPAETVV
ncbi:MAG: DMT family transporter [Acidimicrobiia bacterium]